MTADQKPNESLLLCLVIPCVCTIHTCVTLKALVLVFYLVPWDEEVLCVCLRQKTKTEWSINVYTAFYLFHRRLINKSQRGCDSDCRSTDLQHKETEVIRAEHTEGVHTQVRCLQWVWYLRLNTLQLLHT